MKQLRFSRLYQESEQLLTDDSAQIERRRREMNVLEIKSLKKITKGFWMIPPRTQFWHEGDMYLRLEGRNALSKEGKVVQFKDSTQVQIEVE